MQLTAPELIAARDLLCQADMLVDGVRSLFFNIGNSAPAARLKDIEGRLQDEVQVLERLITKAAPNGEQAQRYALHARQVWGRREALQGLAARLRRAMASSPAHKRAFRQRIQRRLRSEQRPAKVLPCPAEARACESRVHARAQVPCCGQ